MIPSCNEETSRSIAVRRWISAIFIPAESRILDLPML